MIIILNVREKYKQNSYVFLMSDNIPNKMYIWDAARITITTGWNIRRRKWLYKKAKQTVLKIKYM